MEGWKCDLCGQRFPIKYRERHLEAHEKIKRALREYETGGIKYQRKDDREDKKTKG